MMNNDHIEFEKETERLLLEGKKMCARIREADIKIRKVTLNLAETAMRFRAGKELLLENRK